MRYREFMSMSLIDFYWAQRAEKRRQEMAWVHTREIIAVLHNQWAKSPKSGKQLIPLSLDNISNFAEALPEWERRNKGRELVQKWGRLDNRETLKWPTTKT